MVHWDSERCAHSANCLRGNPDVFSLKRRPWVDVDADTAEGIAATVDTCPSGALTYTWVDGDHPVEQVDGVEITATAGGPLYVRGHIELTDKRGNVLRTGPRTALCGCGVSNNAPFCDGSHRHIGNNRSG